MLLSLALTFIIAFGVVYALIPFLRKVALQIGFVDMPNKRKIHQDPIPLIGGTAMVIGYYVTTFFMGDYSGDNRKYIGMVFGGLLMFIVGLIDDFAKTRGKDFPALPKLMAQFIAAGILVYSGIKINGITIPFGSHGYLVFHEWVKVLTTLIWVVAITNMFNFLDGIDGLAGGIAAISAMSLVFISILKDQPVSAMFAMTLIGISLAFLRHNFHPARIFMGDSGSTFLGFTLAAIAVDGAFKSATLVSVLVPVLALGVPIFDTLYVIIKRFRERRPIYKADKSHTHHQLMRMGLTQVQTVSFLYLLGISFSLASIVVLLLNR
jgi:UDP-GlcNAc:undecaprenyl-phosphate/decaprenyl-phosphate GlcNAc-1-phosphate transferase